MAAASDTSVTERLMKENEIRDFFYHDLSTYGLKYGKKELSVEGLRIDIFAIDKNSRGKGLCREMLEYLFDYAGAKNTCMILETHDKENIPIYEHFGFTLVETKESGDASFAEYRMIKNLGS